MPTIGVTETHTLTAGGGTIPLNVNDLVHLYIIEGTATLTSNWTIQPNGTPLQGMYYNLKYKAEIDLDGNDITVFGKTIPPNLSDKTHQISCYYNGAAWEVDFLADISEDNIIPLTALENNPWRPIPVVSEVMVNGDNSPIIINTTQVEGTTESDLLYRVGVDEQVIDIVGRIRVRYVDETSISGDLKVSIMEWVGHTFEPSLGGSIAFRIPIQLTYTPSSSPVTPISVIGAYIEKYPTFNAVYLVIPTIEIGTDTDTDYQGIINLKLQYT